MPECRCTCPPFCFTYRRRACASRPIGARRPPAGAAQARSLFCEFRPEGPLSGLESSSCRLARPWPSRPLKGWMEPVLSCAKLALIFYPTALQMSRVGRRDVTRLEAKLYQSSVTPFGNFFSTSLPWMSALAYVKMVSLSSPHASCAKGPTLPPTSVLLPTKLLLVRLPDSERLRLESHCAQP